MSRARSVGALPEGLPEDHQRFLLQLRQQIEQVRAVAGLGGSGAAGAPIAGTPGLPGPAGPPGDPGGTYTPDLTPPPTPSGVSVTSGISFVAISTDNPTFTEGHGYRRTYVYGAKWTGGALPTFASAVLVHEFVGNFGAFPTDPNTQWHLWTKWETVDGVQSTSPSGGTNGHQTTTGADVSGLLTVLNGQLTASQLHSSLGTRINLIDAADTVSGSVAQRILAEATARGTAITSEATTRAAADTAISATVTTLSATVSSNTAAIASEASTRASADSAISTTLSAVVSQSAGNVAAIAAETTARTNADTALSATITSVSAVANSAASAATTNAAAITTEATARAAGDSANASTITTLTARVDNGNAAAFSPQISWQFDGAVDGWSGYPSFFGSLTAGAASIVGVSNGAGNLIILRNLSASEQFLGARADKVRMRVRRTAGTGWDGTLYFGNAGHGDSSSFRKVIPEPAWGTGGWAIAEWDMTDLTAGGSDWVLGTTSRLRVDLVRSGASGVGFEIDWIAVGTRAHGVSTAAFQQEATVRATETGALFAQYTVKVDVNGYVSGFGLASTLNGDTPFSEFIIRADQFAIAPVQTDNTAADGSPFFHRTAPTTINGVSVPAGTYMKSAFMHNATITTAKIQDLAVTDAKMLSLSVAKLTAGSMAVGAHVRSTTYVSGVSGFTIEANGFAEFNNVTVRGTVHASAGTFSGSLSAATGTFAGALSAATGTFSGNLSAAGGTFTGSLSAVGGTFTGSLSGATGTFAGSLTAATGSFFSSASGQRITINESSSNEARFYGNRGDGTITELASIGINTIGADGVVIAVGDTTSGNSRVGVFARSNSARAIQGSSVSGQGLFGLSTSGEGVWGQSSSEAGVIGISSSTGAATGGVVGTNSSSGPGVYGISTSGYGGRFVGNATRANLLLSPLGALPSAGAQGSLAVVGGGLWFHNGSAWLQVQALVPG